MTSPQEPAREERWRVKLVVSPLQLAVEAYVYHKDTLALNLPGVAVLADPLAQDLGAQGFTDYLNALEAERDAYRQALETISAYGYRGADIAREVLALSSAGQNAQQGPVEPAEAS